MSDDLTERPGRAAGAGTVAGQMPGRFPTKVEIVNPTDQAPLAHQFPLSRLFMVAIGGPTVESTRPTGPEIAIITA
jgi:hypothetical protein